jgi:hypothetical protein
MAAGMTILFAAVSGSAGGVFRSADNGATFSTTNFPLSDARAVATAPSALSTVYAGGNGLYSSTTGGTSWSPASGISSTVQTIAVDPAGIVYAGTSSGVYRSANGSAFQLSGLAQRNVLALAVENGTPATVFAVTSDGLFVTTTGGQ